MRKSKSKNMVDPRDLSRRDFRNDEEHAALDLATTLSTLAGDRVASWAHQVEAAHFVNRCGWIAAVERVVDIQAAHPDVFSDVNTEKQWDPVGYAARQNARASEERRD